MTEIIAYLRDALKDFFFPNSCVVCGGGAPDDIPLCPACRKEFEDCTDAYPTPERKLTAIDNIVVLLPYDAKCRTAIHALKYHGLHTLCPYFGTLLGHKTMTAYGSVDKATVIPVPLHPARLRERGYNQSALIAHGFAQTTGASCEDNILRRTVKTTTQTALGEDERRMNVQNAFTCIDYASINGDHYVLTDDVLTTGSTLGACAELLKKCGAEQVTAAVIATPHPGEE